MRGHLVKSSSGDVKYFRCDLNGISYGSCENKRPEFYELLEEEGKADFDVIADDNNVYHLVCRNNNGDIIYFNCIDNIWTRRTFMKSKYPSNYPKHLRLIKCGRLLSIFYILEKDGNKMLVHQFIKENSPPTVLGYTNGTFDVTKDSFDNIYVAMYNTESKNTVIYRYIWAEKKWSFFNSLNSSDIFDDICIITDNANRLYVTTCENGNIYLYSDKKNYVGKGRKPAVIISDKVYLLFSSPMNDSVFAYSVNINNFEMCNVYQSDGYSKNEFYCISYCENFNKAKAKKCYGKANHNGFEIYKIDNFTDKTTIRTESPDKTSENNGEYDAKILLGRLMENEKTITKLKIQIDEIKRKLKY